MIISLFISLFISLSLSIPQVKVPSLCHTRPYLRAVYDDPEFICRNIWRKYGGWYDGNPARLQPPRDSDLALSVVTGFGGTLPLLRRVENLLESFEKDEKEGKYESADRSLRIARQLIEWASRVPSDGESVHSLRRRVYQKSSEFAGALMAKGIYTSAMKESEATLEAKL